MATRKKYKMVVLDPDTGCEVFDRDLTVTIDAVHNTVSVDDLINALFCDVEEAIEGDLWPVPRVIYNVAYPVLTEIATRIAYDEGADINDGATDDEK